MKTRYKYIHFAMIDEDEYDVVNNRSKETLGFISWDRKWGCHVFTSKGLDYIFNSSCLRDIADFIEQIDGSNGDKP